MSYLAKGCMIIAGALLLFETLLGCVYVLGIGFSSWRDIVTDICVTMAFPIFLIAIASLSKGAVALWAFFIIQWVNTGFDSSHPGFIFVNPLGWSHGQLSFVSAILVTCSAWILCRQNGEKPLRAFNDFKMRS